LNLNSKHYFKAVCAYVLVLAFFFALCSCASLPSKAPAASGAGDSPADGTAPPDTSSEAPPDTAAPPSEPLTDRQIMDAYTGRGLTVTEIRDAGTYTLVHYFSSGDSRNEASRFDWFDRKTGERELVCSSICADKFEITADKTLTILTTGVTPDGYQQFPRILRFGLTDVDGAYGVTRYDNDYYMPLEQSFTLGIDSPECLKSVCYDGGSMLLTFTVRPGYEQEFHADGETVPKMTVTNKDGVSTVTLFDTILSDDFVLTAGKLLGSDPCPVTVSCDGIDTVVTFKMHGDAGRYNIGCFTTPVERVPHAVITYVPDNSDYPKGW
jgi:hypothetical protein